LAIPIRVIRDKHFVSPLRLGEAAFSAEIGIRATGPQVGFTDFDEALFVGIARTVTPFVEMDEILAVGPSVKGLSDTSGVCVSAQAAVGAMIDILAQEFAFEFDFLVVVVEVSARVREDVSNCDANHFHLCLLLPLITKTDPPKSRRWRVVIFTPLGDKLSRIIFILAGYDWASN
jgi:hypothetical protein